MKFSVSLISGLLILGLSTGCQQPKKVPQVVTKDPTLPTVKKLQTISDMSAVALEWFPLSNYPEIAGYNVYRLQTETHTEEANAEKLVKIGQINDRASSHFVDSNLTPNTRYFYRLTSFTNDFRESEPSNMVTAQTSPMLNPIHYIISVGNLARRTKLLWRPHNDPRVLGYIIERNSIFYTEWKEVAFVNNRLSPEYIDKNLENDSIYRYRIRIKTFDNLISEPSKIVEVVTKALPKPVRNIQTTFELPKRIQVSWKANDERDIVYYKIYKSLHHDKDFEFTAKTQETTFTDVVQEDGLRVFYNVTAVDKDGLEGPKNEVSIDGSTLQKPRKPRILFARQEDREIKIKWESEDDRIIKYKIVKNIKQGWGSTKKVEYFTKQREYEDKDVMKNIDYIYEISGIDKFGIESEAVESQTVFIKYEESKIN